MGEYNTPEATVIEFSSEGLNYNSGECPGD